MVSGTATLPPSLATDDCGWLGDATLVFLAAGSRVGRLAGDAVRSSIFCLPATAACLLPLFGGSSAAASERVLA